MRPHPDLEVRSRQLDVRRRDVHQDVGQDGHGVPFLDDALEYLEFGQERFLGDGEFHVFTFLSGFLLFLLFNS